MKFRIAFLFVAVLLGIWIERTNIRHLKEIESRNPIQSIEQQRVAAQELLLKACADSVTGLRAVKEYSINDLADMPSKWTGRATVEYLNQLGGVDRTNLQFIFIRPSGHLACILDPQWIHNQQEQQLSRALEAAHKTQ